MSTIFTGPSTTSPEMHDVGGNDEGVAGAGQALLRADAEAEAALQNETGLFVGMTVLGYLAARLKIEERQHDPFPGNDTAECLGKKLQLGQFFFFKKRHVSYSRLERKKMRIHRELTKVRSQASLR